MERQRELLESNPDLSLLCLTVQLPGPVKRDERTLVVARAGVEAIRDSFKPVFEELRDLETGFEGFFLVSMTPGEAKRLACQIEDTHPLGRLMDIDVITSISSTPLRPLGGLRGVPLRLPESLRSAPVPQPPAHSVILSEASELPKTPSDIAPQPLGREVLGLPPRKCLLCGRPARECMRSRAHKTEELLAKISEMVAGY